MVRQLHPSMTFITVHALRALRGFYGLNFIIEIPFGTSYRFIMVDIRVSPVILNIVGIRTIVSFMAM